MLSLRSRLIRPFITAALLIAAATAYAADIEDEIPDRINDIASALRSAELTAQLRELDRQAQIIKEKTLDIDHAVQAFLDDIAPNSNPTRLFLALDAPPQFQIRALNVDIDGEPAKQITFTAEEAATLGKGGTLRILDLPLAKGNHRVRLTVEGTHGPAGQTRSYQRHSDTDFIVGDAATHIALVLASSRGNRTAVSQTISVTGDADGALLADLYRREAFFLQSLGEPLAAATRLQRASDLGFTQGDADAVNLQLGRIYAQYGLHYLASSAFHKLTDRPIPYPIDNEIWLRLAEQQFRRGQFGLTGLVEYTASRMREPISDTQLARRVSLLGQLYLSQGRYAEAEALLKEHDGSTLGWGGADELEHYAAYNRAISLVNIGQSELGLARLDTLGKRRTSNEEELALRDLANLSLAYYFLDHGDAGTAIPLLKRIRLEGPFSNKALLALGWAELGESGRVHGNRELIAARCANDPLKAMGTSPSNYAAPHRRDSCVAKGAFKREETASTDPKRFRRALRSWLQVRSRSPIHPAVQESLLSIPFGLLRTGKLELARQHYQFAINAFEAETKRIEDALDAVHSRQFLTTATSALEQEWASDDWRIGDISPYGAPDMRLIYRLVARHDFYEALVNFRNLSKVQEQLSLRIQQLDDARIPSQNATSGTPPNGSIENGIGPGWMSFAETYTLSPSARQTELRSRLVHLKSQVDNAVTQHSDFLHNQATQELSIQQQRLRVYSARARLAIARIFDDMLKAIENPDLAPHSDRTSGTP